MLEIDGSQKSGSGTILRISLALAAIKKESLHITNIRHNRKQPGLRPQHLESVNTTAKLCNAEIEGAKLDSRELWFEPSSIVSGEIKAEIGTAGSIPMLLLTILPVCAHAKERVKVHVVNGGTDVRFSPTINYMKHVLLPTLQCMGLKASIDVKRFGYYPKGNGEVVLNVETSSELYPLSIEEFGEIQEIEGISVCTYLEKQKVAERQAQTAINILRKNGIKPKIQVINDKSNPIQKGSSITLWAKTSKGALIGADAIGELKKTSETVGKEATENLLKEIKTQSTVDIHLADMLIPYIALAKGNSSFITRKITEHLSTNICLVKKILGTKIEIKKTHNCYRIQKS